jgi:4'-phosphopantetheinyl transferase
MSERAPLTLPKNELHVWRYTLSQQDYLNELENPVLSEEEKISYSRFVYEKDKRKYICNHIFRRCVLAQYLNVRPADVRYSYTHFGKPFFAGGDIQFSHSYRADAGLLALYKGSEVGIDIEQIKEMQDVATFCDFSFSDAEKKLIFADGSFNKATFFLFWTFKEAFIKAIGTGLNADIRQFDLADFMHRDRKEMEFGGRADWIIRKLPTQENFAAAYAVKGVMNKLVEFNYTETG